MSEGYIKLSRNMLKWRWVSTPNTAYIFILLLLKANFKDLDFEGITVHRGQLVTSLPKLASQSNLTINQVRTAISHLISTGEITSKSYPKFRVITIVKYSEYQDITGKSPGKPQSSHRQTTGRPQQEKEGIIKGKEGKERKEGRSAPNPPSGETGDGGQPHDYPYPCGLYRKPDWMTEEEWETARYMTVANIPGIDRGEYDNIIDYLLAKKEGRV
jgi:hypothetical protein